MKEEFKGQVTNIRVWDTISGHDLQQIYDLEAELADKDVEIARLQGALRQIRNSLGAYRRYEVSVYLEDADNVAKLALDSSDTSGGE